MQSDADVSRALASHERALFSQWEYSQDGEDCADCGEDSRECDCRSGPLWDPEDVERDPVEDYYDNIDPRIP